MARDDGGSAFPSVEYDRDSAGQMSPRYTEYGMSLRDYFAGQALAGMAMTVNWFEPEDQSGAAVASYRIADAMLAQREKEDSDAS